MGQRLVITFKYDDVNIAALYFHWGAYTSASAEYLRDLAECIIEASNAYNITEVLKKWFDKLEYSKTDRNNGLPTFESKEIEDHIYWGEGFINIDLCHKQIVFDVINIYNKKDDEEWISEFTNPVEIKDFRYKFDYTTVEDIVEYSESIINLPDYFSCGDYIYGKIE